MSKKKPELVWKECKECSRRQEVLPEVDKCYACNKEGALEACNAKENNSQGKIKPRMRDHKKGRKVGTTGYRVPALR
ncbi:MAG: hypothetical protein UR60_C0009G0021 [Candidatus Moranbacteria bacterium GW2011_GWF2_34_56]|nr:MAG: hypothetical protein UR51_C0006G0069 [Candidatus Moranbacteria bacterium GW2011_GWF1_34_10]KKP65062.1 MAG: hypothetical protein UR60_C0009G0021 [Candidatus Moranbacteria bacterium GW2011_GWF2_34_56]HBI16650.1 hypothetical protein [Candidatus Moranbacteria bacterium]